MVIPAEIKDGEAVKLTEEEIKINQESYITSVKTLENLEKQKEEIVKSNLSADESTRTLKNIDELIRETNSDSRRFKTLFTQTIYLKCLVLPR